MAAKKSIGHAPDVGALARAAGLDKAFKQFPQDVEIAAKTAQQTSAAIGAPDNVAAEPWPPMRVRSAS